MRWPWRKPAPPLPPPVPIADLDPHTQAVILRGLRNQARILDGKVDEEYAAMRDCGDRISKYENLISEARSDMNTHHHQMRKSIQQRDALAATIAEMEGRV